MSDRDEAPVAALARGGAAARDAGTARDRRPTRRGGWWHAYVCPVHHAELLVPTSDVASVHRCPHGCQLTGEPYDSAALVYRYQDHARCLRLLAHAAADGVTDAAWAATDLAHRLLALHADAGTGAWNEEAEPWMLRGKLFQQALTEAIWSTNVGHGLWTLREAGLVDADLDRAIVRFAGAVLGNVTEARAVLVGDRDDFTSNYTAWLNAAGAVAAWLHGGDAARTAWLDGAHGQFAHAAAASGEDGWEWEGATYYHVFVLRAYLLSLRGLDVASVPPAVRDRLGRMLAVLPAIAAPGGRLPALHDSPYRRDVSDQEILEVVAIGRQLVDVPGLDEVAAAARRSLGDRDDGLDERTSGWVRGTPAATARLAGGGCYDLFAEVGYTVLRSHDRTWRAILDHGPHGGSHGHLDKLSLYVESAAPWQPDVGITPYASAMRAHYAGTVAHPTFRIDGRDQRPCTGRLDRFDVRDDAIVVAASADDAYPGVRARRTLHLTDGWLLDVVDLVAVDGDTHDLALQLRPAVPIDVNAGAPGRFVVCWRHPAGELRTWHVGPVDAATHLVPLPGPADDPAEPVTGVDWSAQASHARFVTVWQPVGVADRLTAVDLDDDHLDVHVTTASGRSTVSVPPLA